MSVGAVYAAIGLDPEKNPYVPAMSVIPVRQASAAPSVPCARACPACIIVLPALLAKFAPALA
jgi:hypothetical protein